MSSSQIDNLISMLNQIETNNNYKKTDEETAMIVANHVKKFWARSMKANITKYADSDGAQLSPAIKLALAQL
ncbi:MULTISPECIES: formate dehydrogenase subunit delta [unclassified Colwellia]|uniref:formate dehydrogenase subunit delta n=1 Tax=unclassified Colwellia TaxID=196834 RepID=UPI0015F6F189|nr:MULTISPECIES: formate dehydrogenase subunit delta [unclassified Colwellia]MBA6288756.1 formate dehydrogenase subunit delta [Colwellia sp. MB3u-4]MBA6297030.1 formate dehydrogenase subunit delta [Colwellia sp. MB02u-9]